MDQGVCLATEDLDMTFSGNNFTQNGQ
jgi:hypothetical protein